jgi:hypothetical protein
LFECIVAPFFYSDSCTRNRFYAPPTLLKLVEKSCQKYEYSFAELQNLNKLRSVLEVRINFGFRVIKQMNTLLLNVLSNCQTF